MTTNIITANGHLIMENQALHQLLNNKEQELEKAQRELRAARLLIKEYHDRLKIFEDGFRPNFETSDFSAALHRMADFFLHNKEFGLEYTDRKWSFYPIGVGE